MTIHKHSPHIRPTLKLDNMRIARRIAQDMTAKYDITIPKAELVALFYDSLCRDEENLRRVNEESYKENGR